MITTTAQLRQDSSGKSISGLAAPYNQPADLIEFLSSLTDNSVLTNERWADPFER